MTQHGATLKVAIQTWKTWLGRFIRARPRESGGHTKESGICSGFQLEGKVGHEPGDVLKGLGLLRLRGKAGRGTRGARGWVLNWWCRPHVSEATGLAQSLGGAGR